MSNFWGLGAIGAAAVTAPSVIPAGAIVFGQDGARGVQGTSFATLTTAGAITSTRHLFPSDSAASAAALYCTGQWYSGGTATTNFPFITIVQPGATTSTNWNPNGTAIGINVQNTASAVIDILQNNSRTWRVDGFGNQLVNGTFTCGNGSFSCDTSGADAFFWKGWNGGEIGWNNASTPSGGNIDTYMVRGPAAGKIIFAVGTTPMLLLGGSTSSFPALKRNSAVMEVKLADDSAFTGLSAFYVLHNGVTFSNRPGSPVAGMVIYVTDSNTATWGATVAGGGANKVLAWYNGTNWTVTGA